MTAIASAWASLPQALLLGLAWAVYVQGRRSQLWPVFFARIVSLRWFLLALLILHGVTVLSSPNELRWELAQAGLRQGVVLLTLLLSVVAVLEPLSLDQRIAALAALFRPLAVLRLQPQRVAAMLALALEQAQDMRRQLLSRPRGGGWKGAIDALAALCWELESQEISLRSHRPIQVEYHSSPLVWSVPLFSVVAMAATVMVSKAG